MLLLTLLAGCSGEIVLDDGGGGPGGGQGGGGTGVEPGTSGGEGETALAIRSPSPASSHARASVGLSGALAAAVPFEAEVGSAVERIAISVDGEGPVAEATAPDFATSVPVPSDGAHTLTAVGYDAGGAEVVVAAVDISVTAPEATGCHEWLDLYGVDYTTGPDRQGVSDPVTVTPPIVGVDYRYVSNDAPRETMFMDCELALSLARAAEHLHARGVVEVADIGIYNYRCIGGGDPGPTADDCANGISQHAFALAIDIAGFTTADGSFASVNDDWVIDAGDSTCEAATEGGNDTLLHELICRLKAHEVWNIVLTPNYNDAHRDHFHVDLKAGSDFIEFADGSGVDVGPDLH